MAKGCGGGHFGTANYGEAEGLPVSLPDADNVYAPRPLITLTVGAETTRYSTEEVYVP